MQALRQNGSGARAPISSGSLIRFRMGSSALRTAGIGELETKGEAMREVVKSCSGSSKLNVPQIKKSEMMRSNLMLCESYGAMGDCPLGEGEDWGE